MKRPQLFATQKPVVYLLKLISVKDIYKSLSKLRVVFSIPRLRKLIFKAAGENKQNYVGAFPFIQYQCGAIKASQGTTFSQWIKSLRKQSKLYQYCTTLHSRNSQHLASIYHSRGMRSTLPLSYRATKESYEILSEVLSSTKLPT